jgi:translation initiation factor 2 subunit 1
MEGLFYPNSLPEPDDLVVGEMVKFENNIVEVILTEFDNCSGQVIVKNMRLKHIKPLVKIGQQGVFRVLEVDPEKKYIDLDLRYVDSNDRKETLDRYGAFKQLRSLVWKVALHHQLAPDETARVNQELVTLLVLDRPLKELTRSYVQEQMRSLVSESELIREIVREYGQKVDQVTHRITGEMLINCFADEGVDQIKRVLSEQLALYQERYPADGLEVAMVKAPHYRVWAQSRDRDRALAAVTELMSSIGEAFKGPRSKFKVSQEAQVVVQEASKS